MLFPLVWLGTLILIVSMWSYDHFIDDTFMGYAKHGYCIPTGDRGILYLVVVPTAIMVLINFGSVIFSEIQFKNAMNQYDNNVMFLKLLKFLCKLVVFQCFQWVFGVVYHFTANTVMKIIFEVLVVFEGLHMAISYFSDHIGK